VKQQTLSKLSSTPPSLAFVYSSLQLFIFLVSHNGDCISRGPLRPNHHPRRQRRRHHNIIPQVQSEHSSSCQEAPINRPRAPSPLQSPSPASDRAITITMRTVSSFHSKSCCQETHKSRLEPRLQKSPFHPQLLSKEISNATNNKSATIYRPPRPQYVSPMNRALSSAFPSHLSSHNPPHRDNFI
jgi:hypothetical protein